MKIHEKLHAGTPKYNFFFRKIVFLNFPELFDTSFPKTVENKKSWCKMGHPIPVSLKSNFEISLLLKATAYNAV